MLYKSFSEILNTNCIFCNEKLKSPLSQNKNGKWIIKSPILLADAELDFDTNQISLNKKSSIPIFLSCNTEKTFIIDKTIDFVPEMKCQYSIETENSNILDISPVYFKFLIEDNNIKYLVRYIFSSMKMSIISSKHISNEITMSFNEDLFKDGISLKYILNLVKKAPLLASDLDIKKLYY